MNDSNPRNGLRDGADGLRCGACRSMLSEYIDEQLDADAEERVGRHLEACPECRGVRDDLVGVRSAAGALGPREPGQDLWPQLRTRLGEAEVVPLRPATDAPRDDVSPSRWRRRVRLTIPQLAAAGLALAFAGGLGAWTLRPLATGPAGDVAGPETAPPRVERVSVETPDVGAGDAVAELEAVLREARDRLDPNTVRVLEKNLALIDRAIAEARGALEVDPGNRFLEDHLRTHEARRLEYLRQTTALLERSS